MVSAGDSDQDITAGALGREPTPAFAAEVADECRRLLAELNDEPLRQLAVWNMDEYTIAEKMGRAVPTVERKLARIRAIWANWDPHPTAGPETGG